MNPENEKHSVPKSELSRAQKIARRLLPAVLVAGGVGGYAAHEGLSADNETHPEVATASASATVSVETQVEFGGSDEGWGHGAAEKAIRESLVTGLTHMSIEVSPDHEKTPELDIQHVIETIPIYDEAEAVLKMAGYGDTLPDAGDKLVVDMEVTLDDDNKVSYEVKDAEIIDLSNNQQS